MPSIEVGYSVYPCIFEFANINRDFARHVDATSKSWGIPGHSVVNHICVDFTVLGEVTDLGLLPYYVLSIAAHDSM